MFYFFIFSLPAQLSPVLIRGPGSISSLIFLPDIPGDGFLGWLSV